MKLGVTGTLHGTTKIQYDNMRLFFLINGKYITELHHGSSIGVDIEAHNLTTPVKSIDRVIYPSTVGSTRVDIPTIDLRTEDVTHPEKDSLERNKDIVDNSEWLLAFPRDMNEVEKSGTWSTVRYARKLDKLISIYWPDGTVTREEPDEAVSLVS